MAETREITVGRRIIRSASAPQMRFQPPRARIPSPIAHMPPELLAKILLECSKENRLKWSFDWLSLTQVCRRWREVALNTAELWTHIDLGVKSKNVDNVATVLTRTKQAPIHIRAHMVPDIEALPDHFCTVLPEISRACSLDLQMSTGLHAAVAKSGNIPSSAPLLKSLKLSAMTDTLPDDPEPLLLDECAMPCLEEVSFTRYPLDWSKLVFPRTLTSLTVINDLPLVGFTPPCSVAEMVRVIQALPLLTTLYLDEVLSPLPNTLSRLPSNSTYFSLPHLENLEITSSALSCLHFLDHFTFPTTTNVCLDFSSMCPIPLMIEPLCSRMGRLKIDYVRISLFSIGLIASIPSDRGPDDPPRHQAFRLRFTGSENMSSRSILGDLCAQLPIQSAVGLYLQGAIYTEAAKEGWVQLLRSLPNIVDLNIRATSKAPEPISSIIFRLLYPFPCSTEEGREDIQEFLMPKLRHITLKCMDFSSDSPYINRGSYELLDVLNYREKAGCLIESITMQECYNMDQRGFDRLTETVRPTPVRIDWDERVEDYYNRARAEYEENKRRIRRAGYKFYPP